MHVSIWMSKNDLQGSGFFYLSHGLQRLNSTRYLDESSDHFSACFLCVGLDFNPFVFLIFLHEVNVYELEVDLSDFIDWALLLLFVKELEHTAANLWRFPGSVPFPTACRLCSALLCSLFFRFSLISKNLTPQGHPSSEESRAQLLPLPNPKVMVPRTYPLYFLPETQLESPLALGDRNPSTQW